MRHLATHSISPPLNQPGDKTHSLAVLAARVWSMNLADAVYGLLKDPPVAGQIHLGPAAGVCDPLAVVARSLRAMMWCWRQSSTGAKPSSGTADAHNGAVGVAQAVVSVLQHELGTSPWWQPSVAGTAAFDCIGALAADSAGKWRGPVAYCVTQ